MKPNTEEDKRKIKAFLRSQNVESYTLDLEYQKPLKVVAIHEMRKKSKKIIAAKYRRLHG